MSDALQGKMARGAVWMVLFKLLERSLGLVSTLILARVLMPADHPSGSSQTLRVCLPLIFMSEK